jgi:hypothetical protein
MSLATRAAVAALAILAALEAPAAAQEELGADRFFAPTPADEDDTQSTTYDGSLTSTTFYYRETGENAPSPATGGATPYSASPVDRLFTDLRGQFDADHIAGTKFDFRADMRGRYTTSYTLPASPAAADGREVPFQSGTFAGEELELRELHVRRDGDSTDVTIGRQYSLELAATRFDGVKIEPSGEHWKFILFGGLYPSRISRDIRDDYPRIPDVDPDMSLDQPGDPIMPVTGGTGTAYRYQSAYGAIGVVGILPLENDLETGEAEKPRVFATSNGYWRQSGAVDFYHYIVADATGAGGAGLTNLTLGVNLQPTPRLRAYASVNRIDTETLNVLAQTKLEDRDPLPVNKMTPNPGSAVQNNLEVQRIAQDSVRLGVSANFATRFEVSTSGTLRRRGELRVESVDGEGELVFPAAQAADVTFSLVDRKSFGGTRTGLSATSSFGVGSANLYRSKAIVARADISKELAEGRAELEADVTYLNSTDDNRGTACNLGQVETCYGAAQVQSITGGALAFYRFSRTWFLITSANVGAQMSKAASVSGSPVNQPTIITSGFLLRLAYRF